MGGITAKTNKRKPCACIEDKRKIFYGAKWYYTDRYVDTDR